MPTYLTFTTADTQFAILLDRSQKVVPLMALKAVPKADSCVAGMMNVGGVSVPVIDLAIRLDLEKQSACTLGTSIAICTRGEQAFGILTDRIDGVLRVDDDGVELADVLATDRTPYLGVCRTRAGQPALILDLDRVLDLTCEVDASIAAKVGAA